MKRKHLNSWTVPTLSYFSKFEYLSAYRFLSTSESKLLSASEWHRFPHMFIIKWYTTSRQDTYTLVHTPEVWGSCGKKQLKKREHTVKAYQSQIAGHTPNCKLVLLSGTMLNKAGYVLYLPLQIRNLITKDGVFKCYCIKKKKKKKCNCAVESYANLQTRIWNISFWRRWFWHWRKASSTP